VVNEQGDKEYTFDTSSNVYEAILRDYVNYEHSQGNFITPYEAENSVEFQYVLIGLMSDDNSPNGYKAGALVALGRRRPEWDWNVGETPGPE